MKPTPKHLPGLTVGLLLGGAAIFILGTWCPRPVQKGILPAGMLVFLAGMIVALAGAIWSLCTLASPALRKTHGLATPIVTMVIASLAWAGALVTVYKFKQSNDVRLEEEAGLVAKLVRAIKPLHEKNALVEKQFKNTPP